jgi:hypothetical protein
VTGEPEATLTWAITDPNSAGGTFAPGSGTVDLDADGAGTITADYTAPDVTGLRSYNAAVDGEDASTSASFDVAVKRAGVAEYLNPIYFRYNPALYQYEASNLEASISNLGYSVSTFTSSTAAEIHSALLGKAVMAIPYDIAVLDFSGVYDTAARAEINQFVNNGGLLLVIDDAYAARLFLTSLGIAFPLGTTVTPPINLQVSTGAAGTPFAGGPSTLVQNGISYSAYTGTLPAGAKSIYKDSNSSTVVTLVPQGAGNVLLLGWSWGDAFPIGIQNGGWLQMLDIALGAAEDETL